MPLAPGTRLGPYEVLAPLGAGGMGEVYRARDSRLGRDVAVKVLPQHLSAEPEVRARFEREARTVSSLNHPHICTLFDVGREADTDFLVMELVEGETLAQRLAHGALPLPEMLRVGGQIADALDRAHKAGVIHRDLKPGNVMLTKSGAKLMDFGLARITGLAGPAGAGGPTVALTQSPTMAAPLTAEGSIVGTFQYMAPEQLEGGEADARSDIWALGCVLYEMATGKRAFEGKSQASLIAAIMKSEPPSLADLAPMTPPALDRSVRQCLAKDPDDRWQTASDLKRELAWIGSSSSTGAGAHATTASTGGGLAWLPGILAALALVAGAFIGWRVLPPRSGGPGRTGAAASGVTAMARLTDSPGRQYSPSLSPDGKMLLYVSEAGGDEDIFLLRVGGENPINLTESYGGADFDPAFSHDGERIAFASSREGGGIFVMGATGESPRKVTNEGAHPSWSPDDRKLVYSSARVTDPFSRGTEASLATVDVATGERKLIYEGDAVEPVWSPSGRRIAFWAVDRGQRDVKTVDAEGRDLQPVTNDVSADWRPFWAPDGRALYFLSDRGGSPDLWRVSIDEGSGKVRGEPEPVTTGVAQVMAGSISADGKRIAVTVDDAQGEILRMGFDPATARPRGQPISLFASSNPMGTVSVSSDGGWITYNTTSPLENVFIMRSDGTQRRRLTDDAFRNRGPVWVRGNDWVMFYSNRDGHYCPWLIRRDGTELRKFAQVPNVNVTLPKMSPDGTRLSMTLSGLGGLQLGIARVGDWFSPGKPPEAVVVDTVAKDFMGVAWSPDGTRIVGAIFGPQGAFPALYSFSTQRIEPRQDLFGVVSSLGCTWLPDARRVLAWDSLRNTAILWDVESGAIHDVGGIPGPSELRLSADGRTLIVNRTIEQGDVWLLTLR